MTEFQGSQRTDDSDNEHSLLSLILLANYGFVSPVSRESKLMMQTKRFIIDLSQKIASKIKYWKIFEHYNTQRQYNHFQEHMAQKRTAANCEGLLLIHFM